MAEVLQAPDYSKAPESFKAKVYWLLKLGVVLAVLYMGREALVVAFTAFIFASALLPFVERLDHRLPRWLAVLIPYSILTLVGLGLVLPIVTLAVEQFRLFMADVPQYLDQIKLWATDWSVFSRRYPFLSGLEPNALFHQISLRNSQFFSGFTGLTMTVSQVALDLLSALIISIFLLLDREKIQQYLLRFRPAREHAELNALIEDLIRSTGGFVTGQLLFMITFGTLIALGLYAIGLPFAILLGFLAGLLTIIPILGANIAMIPALLIAMLPPGGPMMASSVFVLFIIVQILENNVIGPLIMGRAVGLHPLAILISLLVGGMMFGMVGIILAIPVVACLNILLNEWFLDPEHRHDRLIRLRETN